MRVAPPARITVTHASHWEQTGIVAVAFLDEDVECPLMPRRDRETGCAKADDARARHVFERLSRSPHGITKLRRRLLGDTPMIPAVRGNFVTGRGNLTDQIGRASCRERV